MSCKSLIDAVVGVIVGSIVMHVINYYFPRALKPTGLHPRIERQIRLRNPKKYRMITVKKSCVGVR
jgi:hypothetical protein